ncbi:MAG: cyclic peptide export ABC transporter [Planctomycetota bacterium]
MSYLWRIIQADWPTLTFASLLGAASGVANVVLLALIHRALNANSAGSSASSTLCLLFAAACLVALITRIASQLFLVRMSQQSLSRLRLNLSHRILGAPLRTLEEMGAHRLMNALTNDVQTLAAAFNSLPTLIVNLIILVCGSAYLGWLSLPLLFFAIVFATLGFLSYWTTARFAGRFLRDSREAQDGVMQQLRNLIRGIKELQMHQPRRHEYMNSILEPADHQLRQLNLKSTMIQDTAVVWGRLLFLIAIGLLLFVWPRWADVPGSTLAGYTLAIFYLMTPLERIIGSLPTFSRAMISVQKLQQLGLLLADSSENAHQPSPALRSAADSTPTALATRFQDWRLLELSQVTHEYQVAGREHGFELGPVNLQITRGEIVFLVGGNGCGKTTLIKLLTGLYQPAAGAIRIDGRDVTAADQESYRQLFTAVFDDGMVFDGLWGLSPAAVHEQAHQLLTDLQLDHAVQIIDRRFSTTELSRGQRKRLALLTAYIEDRSIYLFDEWAADQDPHFKRIFYEQLLPDLKQRGRTVIAITHDDRYFAVADRIIKVTDGQVVEQADRTLNPFAPDLSLPTLASHTGAPRIVV